MMPRGDGSRPPAIPRPRPPPAPPPPRPPRPSAPCAGRAYAPRWCSSVLEPRSLHVELLARLQRVAEGLVLGPVTLAEARLVPGRAEVVLAVPIRVLQF